MALVGYLIQRIQQYTSLSTLLSNLRNEKLKQILRNSHPMYEGMGGKSALVHISDIPVFVKKNIFD